jgi:deoxycytidine triphosphate deaminase
MLSSDLIEYYQHMLEDTLIDPFDRSRLKPASYELTLGPHFYHDGERQSLTEQDRWLTLPKNSIVFVSMNERIMLPHYLAARFDLAIEFIYQGILLGTGPQVDPGFQGVLGCPLHNISDEPVHIELDYPFVKIDFAKTSGLRAVPADALRAFSREADLYAAVERETDPLTGRDGYPVKLFNKRNRWRQPIYSQAYVGQKAVDSSLAEMEQQMSKFGGQVSQFGQDISRFRRFGIAAGFGIALGVIALIIALAQLDRSYTDAKVANLANPTTTTASGASTAGATPASGIGVSSAKALTVEVAALEVRLAALEKKLKAKKAISQKSP